MAFQFFTPAREQKVLSWAAAGLLIFISAFLWAPSRDGLQGVYLLAFFLPTLFLLLSRPPNLNEYGGWPTVIALAYAGFSVLSTLWGKPEDFAFFAFQWLVFASWLCGSSLILSKREIDIEKYLSWLVALGVLITTTTFIHHFKYVDPNFPPTVRLVGWNIFRNPNEIGAFCGLIALLAFTIAIQSSSLKKTWLFYAAALIASIGLLVSFSRGALLAFIVLTPVALLIVRPPLKVWLPPVLTATVAFLILLGATNTFTSYTEGRGEGLGGRYDIWKYVIENCGKNMLLGIGMAKDTNIRIPNYEIVNHAHNAWLDTLYRTGVIGLILILLHLVAVVKKTSYSPRLLPLYLWLGYGCICSLFDGRCFFWEINAKWFLYWVPIALIVAIPGESPPTNLHKPISNQ